ncbi:MAG: ABC transporter substrate-binding protein, partial [Cyanobacteria bacterium P01_D01_bin.105]
AGYSWDWQNNFRLFAQALGKAEQAEQKLAEYQQQLQALKESFNDLPDTTSVSILSATSNGLIAPSLSSFSGSILEDLELLRNGTQGIKESSFVRLSKEDLAGADGDVLFLIYNPTWADTPKDKFVADLIWSQLNAVKQGAVCEVAGDVWSSGRSVLAAQRVLQDVENCFKKVF